MKINKRIVLFMLVVNAMLVISDIWHFFYFRETIFKNFKAHTHYIAPIYYYADMMLLGLSKYIVFIGMYWILRIFKDRKWVKISILLLLICRLCVVLSGTVLKIWLDAGHSINMNVFEFVIAINNLLTTFMLFSFLFVRNKTIRRHFIAFAILMALAYLLPTIETPLYDNFGHSWLLINQSFLIKLPFVISLVLFIDVFNLTQKSKSEKLNDREAASTT